MKVLENRNVEIWWNRSVETEQKVKHNCPDITVVDPGAQEWMFANFLVP